MFIFLSCFSRFVRPCYYAPEKGKKVPRKNFLPLSPVQISLVTPSFDKISELGKRKILPANDGYSRIYLGAHWPSDVITTLFLGIGEALLLLGLFELIWKTAARECRARRLESVALDTLARLAAAAMATWANCGRESRTRPQINFR